MTPADRNLEDLIRVASARATDPTITKPRRRAWARRLAHLIRQRTPQRVAEMEREKGLR